jgi:hypothetical protein
MKTQAENFLDEISGEVVHSYCKRDILDAFSFFAANLRVIKDRWEKAQMGIEVELEYKEFPNDYEG